MDCNVNRMVGEGAGSRTKYQGRSTGRVACFKGDVPTKLVSQDLQM